jgi:NifU-like protein involved in Fe-S cluster formation
MKYSETIHDHFRNPRHIGPLPGATAVGSAENGVCLDTLRLFLRVKDGAVEAASFQAEGCVPSIACGSFLAEAVIGRRVQELARWDAETIEEAVGGLPSTKKHAAALAADALADALAKLHGAV